MDSVFNLLSESYLTLFVVITLCIGFPMALVCCYIKLIWGWEGYSFDFDDWLQGLGLGPEPSTSNDNLHPLTDRILLVDACATDGGESNMRDGTDDNYENSDRELNNPISAVNLEATGERHYLDNSFLLGNCGTSFTNVPVILGGLPDSEANLSISTEEMAGDLSEDAPPPYENFRPPDYSSLYEYGRPCKGSS